MEQNEVPHHSVEQLVGKRECLRVAPAELETRVQPRGERDHPLGQVHSHDRGAALGGETGRIAGTGGDIQHAAAGTHFGAVE